jgi:hypothetical protein
VIVAVPVLIPVSRPELEPIVATDGLALVHIRPVADASVRIVGPPAHILIVPAIAVGNGCTVIRKVR